jgi:hypothetical protein
VTRCQGQSSSQPRQVYLPTLVVSWPSEHLGYSGREKSGVLIATRLDSWNHTIFYCLSLSLFLLVCAFCRTSPARLSLFAECRGDDVLTMVNYVNQSCHESSAPIPLSLTLSLSLGWLSCHAVTLLYNLLLTSYSHRKSNMMNDTPSGPKKPSLETIKRREEERGILEAEVKRTERRLV